MRIAILLPTYNEEENIGNTIRSIRSVSKKYEIFVVDSESKDRTVEIAKKLGALVIAICTWPFSVEGANIWDNALYSLERLENSV
ncbi:MAG: glycosyltransferase, partial [Candidatus Micrarchaeia archaeon]